MARPRKRKSSHEYRKVYDTLCELGSECSKAARAVVKAQLDCISCRNLTGTSNHARDGQEVGEHSQNSD